MQNFLKNSALGLLTIVTVAVLGYFVLMPPTATAALPSAAEIASHSADCTVCRLPLYGQRDAASKFGPDSRASAAATQQGTIVK
jgi:hypothetical protein